MSSLKIYAYCLGTGPAHIAMPTGTQASRPRTAVALVATPVTKLQCGGGRGGERIPGRLPLIWAPSSKQGRKSNTPGKN